MSKTLMKTQWVAYMYPLNIEDVDALYEDIKANGQVTPIKQLLDGRIIDGRNRWLACEKAGVVPSVEIINPDGEEVTDEKAFAIATSCNSMRRDMTTSLRACLAAEAWNRLHPDGNAPGQGRKKKGEELRTESDLNYTGFAKKNFKASRDPAKQALAILNHSAELLEVAKDGIDGAYKTYQEEKAKREEEKRDQQLLKDHADLKERVANGSLTIEEALTLAKTRDMAEIEKNEAVKQQRHLIAQNFCRAVDNLHHLVTWETDLILEILDNEIPRTQMSTLGEEAEIEAIKATADVLAAIYKARTNK